VRIDRALSPGAIVRGDSTRLRQCAWNLLSNAVKFSKRGGRVDVSVARVESYVQIRVSGDGQGIDPAFLPHVFDRFRQADGTITRTEAGLGLGSRS
jgi:signal transduction histidine kinase